jgi:hypothetical protein
MVSQSTIATRTQTTAAAMSSHCINTFRQNGVADLVVYAVLSVFEKGCPNTHGMRNAHCAWLLTYGAQGH